MNVRRGEWRRRFSKRFFFTLCFFLGSLLGSMWLGVGFTPSLRLTFYIVLDLIALEFIDFFELLRKSKKIVETY